MARMRDDISNPLRQRDPFKAKGGDECTANGPPCTNQRENNSNPHYQYSDGPLDALNQGACEPQTNTHAPYDHIEPVAGPPQLTHADLANEGLRALDAKDYHGTRRCLEVIAEDK